MSEASESGWRTPGSHGQWFSDRGLFRWWTINRATLALRLVGCAFSFQCGACEADDRLGLPAKEPQSLWEARLCATLAGGRSIAIPRKSPRSEKRWPWLP